MKRNVTVKITVSALCIAVAIVLPFFTGQIKQIGNMLCPMHFPVMLCGFICGWQWGLAVGFVSPLMRSFLFGMPLMFPSALGMAFELAAYGIMTGLLYKAFPKKIPYIYLTLIISMICGRLVWGAVRFSFTLFAGVSFPVSMFLTGAVTECIPGVILQLILIPITVVALKKVKIIE